MDLQGTDIQIDALKLSKVHKNPVPEHYSRIINAVDHDGFRLSETYAWRSHYGEFGSNFRARSDGQRVQILNNPSRWNQPHSLNGVSIRKAIQITNQQAALVGLPEFDGESTVQLLHVCADVELGSKQKAQAYIDHLKTIKAPRLKPGSTYPTTVNFGDGSETKRIKAYIKSEAVRTQNTHTDEKEIAELERRGVVRLEVEYRYKSLKALNWRKLSNLTQAKLVKQFKKDTAFMTKEYEMKDLDEIPKKYIGTLSMYLMGIDPREKMHRNTFNAHRNALKKYGYDISVMSVERLKPKTRTLVLKVAEWPEGYNKPKHLKAV